MSAASRLAKRVLEIAAAGFHSLLLLGPPGTGKSMLAQRLAGIPAAEMTEAEALESAAIASLAGRFTVERWRMRPFRAPHHTASGVALVGGGSDPRPGEISLAHHGVLFLDELPEWDRRVIEVLREPLESGTIHVSRAARQSVFPAQFQLVAAMNPCPCGWLGHASGRCRCAPDQVDRYRRACPVRCTIGSTWRSKCRRWMRADMASQARACGRRADARCARARGTRACTAARSAGQGECAARAGGSRTPLRAARRRASACSRKRWRAGRYPRAAITAYSRSREPSPMSPAATSSTQRTSPRRSVTGGSWGLA